MIKFTKNDLVDTELYDEVINRLGYILIDKAEANAERRYLEDHISTLESRANFIMQLHSGGDRIGLNRNVIYSFLTKYEKCPEHYFYTNKSESFSLDSDKVLSKLIANGRAVEFLEAYMEYKSTKVKASKLKSLLDGSSAPHGTDKDGNKLCEVHFEASIQKNLRFNYKQFDIISQIPKNIARIIAVEDGYFLAWGDFAQSDLRIAYNLFMRSPENDAIMCKYDDKYEVLARLVANRLGQQFDAEKFQNQRKLYKKHTLATVYGTRSSLVPEDDEFIKMLTEFLYSCPKYVEYTKRINDHLELRTPIEITSYFGFSQFSHTDIYDQNSALFNALNSPVQTGTSELVILTVSSILQAAREVGLNEDQFSLYLTRHDEPVFRVRKDAIPKLWFLAQYSTILVDDWTPLNLDFEFGYRYKESDDGLTAEITKVMDANSDKIVTIPEEPWSKSDFYPVKALLRLNVHWLKIQTAGVTVVTFQEAGTAKFMFSLVNSLDDADIQLQVRLKIKNAETNFSGIYDNVLVKSNFYEGEDYFGDTHVIYKKEEGAGLRDVSEACEKMAVTFCLKQNYQCDYTAAPYTEFPEKLTILISPEA